MDCPQNVHSEYGNNRIQMAQEWAWSVTENQENFLNTYLNTLRAGEVLWQS
jgi:hypothetical protein